MSDTDAIQVHVRSVDDVTILSPKGEIDLSRAPALRKHITAAQASRPRKLIIDLGGVPYMDSSGVATLVEAMQNARRAGGKLVLCALQDKVRSIFEIARLDTVFVIARSADEEIGNG
jgi:anti-sigma B factor antagonist